MPFSPAQDARSPGAPASSIGGFWARRLLPCALLAALTPAFAAPDAPRLSVDSALATAGFFQLHWSGDYGQAVRYRIEQASGPDFEAPRTIYTGPDRASLLSGYADGRYFFRARARLADGTLSEWSAPLLVRVAHHPLARAWGFFAVGAIVFLAVLAVILRGAREESR